MVVKHNLLGLNANRQLGMVRGNLSKTTEKLSSGYKINRAADDAAGLSISEKMRKQIRGLSQAAENIQDGISLCQVADGALNETVDILQRMNELAIQAANGTNSDNDRKDIQLEIDQLSSEINRIAETTSFNEWIYPLKGYSHEYLHNSSGIPNTNPTNVILDGKILENPILISTSNINNYSSYVDSNGKTHYILGQGTFQIKDLTNCVFDLNGKSAIVDTDLKNVSICCKPHSNISVKNVKIDNSANVTSSSGGIGAAIEFIGAGNILNCYETNEFNGGKDCYTVYNDSLVNSSSYLPCAGINVGSGAELTINGTDTSSLIAHGCSTSEPIGYKQNNWSEAISYPGACAIGSNFHENGGNIIINSGNIFAYSGIDYHYPTSSGAIGGGNNTSVIINGGTVNAYSGGTFCIGGGDTEGDSIMGSGTSNITINGGDIYAEGYRGGTVIGYLGNGSVNIYDGNVSVYTDEAATCIGNGSTFSDSSSNINIYGGNVLAINDASDSSAIGSSYTSYSNKNALVNVNLSGGIVTAKSKKGSAIGSATYKSYKATSVNTYVDGTLTNASGTSDGTYLTYSYNNPSPQAPIPSNPTGSSLTNYTKAKIPKGIWIQSTDEAHKGLYINLVDASMRGLFSNSPNISVLNESSCNETIDKVNEALKKVSGYRSYFGAVQNRLEHAYNINQNTVENTQFAESQIRDTDMASEMVKHSNNTILAQVGQSMLAQANQSNQGVLSLIA